MEWICGWMERQRDGHSQSELLAFSLLSVCVRVRGWLVCWSVCVCASVTSVSQSIKQTFFLLSLSLSIYLSTDRP